MLLIRCAVCNQRRLWDKTGKWAYLSSPKCNRTGIKFWRFEDIWQYLRWSKQPKERPYWMPHSTWRWILVNDFVKDFNKYRASYCVPSDLICVDKTMSKWYGLGRNWINMGFPMYVVIDCKTANGCKIKNSYDARSQVMMQLKLVKSEADEDRYMTEIRVDVAQQRWSVHLLHVTKVIIYLVKPWRNIWRTVCTDSYFASITAVDELEKIGLHFFGVVKTAKKYILCTS